MELSPVTSSRSRKIRNQDVEEEERRKKRQDETEQIDKIKGINVADRSDLGIHGAGIG
jgi:hypothetical protein